MINQTVVITNATAQAIYEVLLDSKKHTLLIGDTATIDPKVGGSYSTFSNYANGEIVALEPNKKITQTWRASDWPEGHYSTITFALSDTPKGAKIVFTQNNLPTGTEAEFIQGWQDNYWQPLQTYFAQ